MIDKIKCNCKRCNNVFYVYPSTIKWRGGKFCSRKCFGKTVTLICHICKTTFKRVESALKRHPGSGRYCSKKCMYESNKTVLSLRLKGRKFTKEWKDKLSVSHSGKPRLYNRGVNHYRWKGNRAERYLIYHRIEYKQWRTKVFERDDFTCQWCKQKGGRLNADHIKPFSLFPELRFELSNGRTLCIDCHRKTETYGGTKKVLQLDLF